VIVREMRADESRPVLVMMRRLWPDCDDQEVAYEAVLVVERDTGGLGGFLALDRRSCAEGCTSRPVAYVEGWWVDEDLRRRGWGRRLMQAAEAWARAKGSRELASDTHPDNEVSLRAHRELGFDEVERSVCLRKIL
jgi:aminoglycoside 6'-N-acetyltransferase I